MKKLLLIIFLLIISLPVFSAEDTQKEDIEVLEKLGLINKSSVVKYISPKKEIKNFFKFHEKYTNEKNIEGLKALYSDKYISCDGFDKAIYLELADKTWKTYKNIKYKSIIKSIDFIDNNNVIVEVEEYISGLSSVGTKYIKDGYGFLDNISKCTYLLEKINGNWQIVSDNIFFERTELNYGAAKYIPWYLSSPSQVKAGENYEIALHVLSPKNSMVIATIGKEEVTYPQISAEEVFRNFPESGFLARIVAANTKNINEYAVTFFVLMQTNQSESIENFKMKVSGVGMAMNRVNVIPRNKYIKKVKDEKISEKY